MISGGKVEWDGMNIGQGGRKERVWEKMGLNMMRTIFLRREGGDSIIYRG